MCEFTIIGGQWLNKNRRTRTCVQHVAEHQIRFKCVCAVYTTFAALRGPSGVQKPRVYNVLLPIIGNRQASSWRTVRHGQRTIGRGFSFSSRPRHSASARILHAPNVYVYAHHRSVFAPSGRFGSTGRTIAATRFLHPALCVSRPPRGNGNRDSSPFDARACACRGGRVKGSVNSDVVGYAGGRVVHDLLNAFGIPFRFVRAALRCSRFTPLVSRHDRWTQDARRTVQTTVEMIPFADLFHRVALLVFTPKCYEVLFIHLDFFNGERARFSGSSERSSSVPSKAYCSPDETEQSSTFQVYVYQPCSMSSLLEFLSCRRSESLLYFRRSNAIFTVGILIVWYFTSVCSLM